MGEPGGGMNGIVRLRNRGAARQCQPALQDKVGNLHDLFSGFTYFGAEGGVRPLDLSNGLPKTNPSSYPMGNAILHHEKALGGGCHDKLPGM